MSPKPIVIIDSVSDSGEVRLCRLKMKQKSPGLMFSAEASGVEYLPGKKMDFVALYTPVHDEILLRVTSGKRRIIAVAAKLGSCFEASTSLKADTELRISIDM